MPKKLLIKQFGGDVIASVELQNGELIVKTLMPELQEQVEKLIHRVALPSLPLMSGRNALRDGVASEVTVLKNVSIGADDYLDALSTAVSAPECMVNGVRVRGWVEPTGE